MSDRRKLTSPQNGRLSHGPTTQAGKDRSRRNALRHGILASQVLVDGEQAEAFLESVRSFYGRFHPIDDVEKNLVDEMASAHWRIQRIVMMETHIVNEEIALHPSELFLDYLTGAFQNFAETKSSNLFHRYDVRLHRTFHRALHDLLALKKCPSFEPPPDPPCTLQPSSGPRLLESLVDPPPQSANHHAEPATTSSDEPEFDWTTEGLDVPLESAVAPAPDLPDEPIEEPIIIPRLKDLPTGPAWHAKRDAPTETDIGEYHKSLVGLAPPQPHRRRPPSLPFAPRKAA